MKQTIKKRTVEVEEMVYTAGDGTEFKTKEECKKYEDGAVYAVTVALKNKPIAVKFDHNGDVLYHMMGWNDDEPSYFVWKPESQDDIERLLQYIKVKYHAEAYLVSKCALVPNTVYILMQSNEDDSYIDIFEEESFIKDYIDRTRRTFRTATDTIQLEKKEN